MKLDIRKHINATSVIAFIALAFATTGGALAAVNNPPKAAAAARPTAAIAKETKSKSKPKSKTGPAGPRGLAGPGGPTGPAGPAGSAGPAGAKGETGSAGLAGPAGVKGETGPAGLPGKEGEKGEKGEEGSPWTDGGTLPPEKTETGTWTLGEVPASVQYVPISFPIPLAPPAHAGEVALSEKQVHFVHFGATAPAECAGGTYKAPAAAPGNLCVYESLGMAGKYEEDVEIRDAQSTSGTAPGAGPTGAFLVFGVEETSAANGTWAVTAPAATP